MQAWALNRYYYQSSIPIKDAVVISRFRDRDTRIEWRHRIADHDGDIGTEGGIERWLQADRRASASTRLCRSRPKASSRRPASPSTPMSISSATAPPLEAIASSLTELFAPNLHEERISGMLEHYDFINPDVMTYFSRRLDAGAARRRASPSNYVKAHANTPERARSWSATR